MSMLLNASRPGKVPTGEDIWECPALRTAGTANELELPDQSVIIGQLFVRVKSLVIFLVSDQDFRWVSLEGRGGGGGP